MVAEKYSLTALSLLKANLGYYDSELPPAVEDDLKYQLSYAFRELARAGLHLTPGDLYDDELQAMYATWLYRKRREGLAKPPMLAQAIRDRQVEKALEGDTV